MKKLGGKLLERFPRQKEFEAELQGAGGKLLIECFVPVLFVRGLDSSRSNSRICSMRSKRSARGRLSERSSYSGIQIEDIGGFDLFMG